MKPVITHEFLALVLTDLHQNMQTKATKSSMLQGARRTGAYSAVDED